MNFALRPVLHSLGFCAAVALAPTVHATPTYGALIRFDIPGATDTQVWDVNDGGQMVGGYGEQPGRYKGYVWSNGIVTDIAPPGARNTVANGISNTGVIVGHYEFEAGGRGFIFENGSYSDFVVSGARNTELRHISSDGRFITGHWYDETGSHAFVLDRSTNLRTDIPILADTISGGVNVSGIATGSYYGSTVEGGYTYGIGPQLLTTYSSVGAGLSAPAFRDINDAGLIVGYAGSTGGFVGTPNNWTLFGVPPDSRLIAFQGLNNSGVLVGYTLGSGGTHGFYALAVPEPSQWALMLLGTAALPFLRRRVS